MRDSSKSNPFAYTLERFVSFQHLHSWLALIRTPNGSRMVLLWLEAMEEAVESINSTTHLICMLLMIKLFMSLIQRITVLWEGNRSGKGDHQLDSPFNVIVDRESDTLIISDKNNQRLVRWPRKNGTQGETIISNMNCTSVTMDENASLCVTD